MFSWQGYGKQKARLPRISDLGMLVMAYRWWHSTDRERCFSLTSTSWHLTVTRVIRRPWREPAALS